VVFGNIFVDFFELLFITDKCGAGKRGFFLSQMRNDDRKKIFFVE